MAVPHPERFLVTGALGCIGAWTVRTLVAEGVPVVAFDRAGEARRLRLILDADALAAVRMVSGDITDLPALERVLEEHDISHVIHLAALQVPFAKADPPLGALVNVVGTVNVFEAVKRHRDRRRAAAPPAEKAAPPGTWEGASATDPARAIERVVYAGSIGMFDAADADVADGRLHEDAAAHPRTHYGVYKLANEGNARIYWQDDGLSSVALRPWTVYGPGRDQGLTSDPTRAILAAILGRPFRIGFGGRMLFQYAPDVARAFIAASRNARPGALAYNLPGSLASVEEFVAAIDRSVPGAADLVAHAPEPLPFPAEVEAASVAELGDIPVTPLDEAVAETVALFRARLADGMLVPEEHGLAA